MLNLNASDLCRIEEALLNSIDELSQQDRYDDIAAVESTIKKLRVVQSACSEASEDQYVALNTKGNMQNLGLYPDMTTALESSKSDEAIWVVSRDDAQRWALDLLALVGLPTSKAEAFLCK